MVLEEGSYGQTDILHEVQVTYQKKQSRDRLKIRNHQAASEEAVFPLYFTLFSKHWLIRPRYRSGMRRMLDTDLLA